MEEEPDGSEELPKEVKRSLVMLLNSIALWYIGYNGVTTWWTTYVGRVMGQGLGGASTCLLVATGGAIVSYIPVGQLASKIGRKKTIQGGVILLAACFASAYFLTTHYQSINAVMFVVFALVGLAWAAINVNSLPMVVEMCKGSDIGKFTGYYYTFSMAAQLLGGRSAQLVIQALAGQGDVPLEAALYPGVVGLAHRTGGQHHIEQLGLFGVAAGGADADDVVHIVELEQLIGIDSDGRHTHTASHDGDFFSFVGSRCHFDQNFLRSITTSVFCKIIFDDLCYNCFFIFLSFIRCQWRFLKLIAFDYDPCK